MSYIEVKGWGGDRWSCDVTGVAVDAEDRVYALKRGELAVTVLDSLGNQIGTWGHSCISNRPHLISIGPDNLIYIADDGGHQIHVFDLAGRLQESIGSGTPSGTGYDAAEGGPEGAYDHMLGGAPFNRPTKAVASSNGDLYVSDGYRNCRIHRISPDRSVVKSWGGPGSAAGCFVIPHSVAVDAWGRVYVCDRENDRVQIFSSDGTLLNIWTNVQRPTDLAFDKHGHVYITELPRGPLDIKSWRLGRATEELPGRVSVRFVDGSLIQTLDIEGVDFPAPHAIAVDSAGAIYVSEVPESFASYTGRPLKPHRSLRKFVKGS